ncbi:hypothetical protein Tco_1434303 [Tanacetum coccineum]
MESKLVCVICACTGQLGFCHIGDDKWKCVEQPLDNPIFDITFYNGQVYSFNLEKIQACNVNGKDPTILVDVATIPDEYDQHEFSAYIVGLDDGDRKQLLVIMRYIEEYIEELLVCDKTQSFQVLAYDLDSGNWSKVKDFGTKTLFVGFTSSFWVEDTRGVIKSNCIYYTNYTGRDMGIYHLLDGTIKPLYFAGESLSCVTPPMWLQSIREDANLISLKSSEEWEILVEIKSMDNDGHNSPLTIKKKRLTLGYRLSWLHLGAGICFMIPECRFSEKERWRYMVLNQTTV